MNGFVELTDLTQGVVCINVSAIRVIHPNVNGTAVHLDGGSYHVEESYEYVKNSMSKASVVNTFVKMDG